MSIKIEFMGDEFGPYNLKGENEESLWAGHRITGRHWGTPIGEIATDLTYSDDWSTEEGTLKPKLPGIKGKYHMERKSVSDDEVVYEGYSRMMGFTTPMRMVVRRDKLINTGVGEAEEMEETNSALSIEPRISDKDWADFTGKREVKI
jgi:hypothetical protein